MPETFGNLTALQYLRIEQNQMTSLPETFGNLAALNVLKMSQNQLRSLPESMANLRRLRKWSLDHALMAWTILDFEFLVPSPPPEQLSHDLAWSVS